VSRSKRRDPWAYDHEPALEDDDSWQEWGGELYYAVDHTAGGAPLGLTLGEFRRMSELDSRGAGWARAKRVLRELLDRERGGVEDVGFVKKIGDGLSREIFAAEVLLREGFETFAVALPRADAEPELDERTTRELRLLSRLRHVPLPFRIPEPAGAFPDGERLALVRRFVRGIELELRAGRQDRIRPWEIVATCAAAIHAVPLELVRDVVPGFATRREHAAAVLTVFDALEAPEARDARAWAEAHLPPDEPAALVHGDLLGPNILLSRDGPHHVIDWEYAMCGDPGFDLAIVTRGAKRPFDVDRGLERLLDVYRAHGGRDLSVSEVRLHELALVTRWYREAVAARGHRSAEGERGRLRSLLKRLT
jgi:aminoglycoside phosphotransferase (APT) family kinase protein